MTHYTVLIASSNGVNGDLVGVLIMGALALALFAWVYLRAKSISATFSRIYALIVIGVLGAGLGFASINSASRTAGFTLLGTIAGYLAGTKTQTAPASRKTSSATSSAVASRAVGGPLGEEPSRQVEEEGPYETYL